MRTKLEIETRFALRESLSDYKTFFLVGIGGAGMSALAKMLMHQGFQVLGSDASNSTTVQSLQSDGIQVFLGHSEEFIQREQALVLTDAIDLDASPEVRKAEELGCPLFRRSQVLGWLLKNKKVIAVTGTHGKTTTTGMLGYALIEAGLDPTVVVGAEIPQWSSSIRFGQGEYAVIEACEAYDALQDFDPYVAVLTNLEPDHLDYHGNFEALEESVLLFLERVPAAGCLIYCADDPGAAEIADKSPVKAIAYNEHTIAELFDDKCVPRHGHFFYGTHNWYNALGALKSAHFLGVRPSDALRGIAKFKGAERRLQLLKSDPVKVIDDYAHHPTEVTASLQAIRDHFFEDAAYGGANRLVVVFQPHLYSRTQSFIKEFAEALSIADIVVITDIYPAREDPIPGVSSSRIAELVTKPVHYVPSRHLLPRFVKSIAQEGDVVVCMGAGNISEFGPAFLNELDHENTRKIAVIYGGDSAEREVSIHSGLAVHKALLRKGHQSELFDVSELLLSKGDLSRFVGANRPDLAFLAVHGTNAEDGAIQGFFELLHIPYTGSRIQASALAMNKEFTKQILEQKGLPVPKGVLLKQMYSLVDTQEEKELNLQIEILLQAIGQTKLTTHLVVKPNEQGSTVGLSFVKSVEELAPAIKRAFQYGSEVLVEEWIEGVEISVPVLGDQALPPVEILPVDGVYDFVAKYTPGATEEICPARLNPEQTRIAKEYALRAHQALGCQGVTRTDMIVIQDQLVVLEVNTLPGMTPTSLLPKSAEAAGMSFDDLVEWMALEALERFARQS